MWGTGVGNLRGRAGALLVDSRLGYVVAEWTVDPARLVA